MDRWDRCPVPAHTLRRKRGLSPWRNVESSNEFGNLSGLTAESEPLIARDWCDRQPYSSDQTDVARVVVKWFVGGVGTYLKG